MLVSVEAVARISASGLSCIAVTSICNPSSSSIVGRLLGRAKTGIIGF